MGILCDFSLPLCGMYYFNKGTTTPKSVGVFCTAASGNLSFNLIDNAAAQVGTAIAGNAQSVGFFAEVPVAGWN